MDDNWYEFGDFPFDFRVDTELGTRAAAIASSLALATKTVSYDGFPIDTGVLVVQRFVNPQNTIPVAIVSCNIYAGQEDSLTLGRAVRQAIEESGKRAVVIACTGLSARFFTEAIDPQQDRFSRAEDDIWNRRILDLISARKKCGGAHAQCRICPGCGRRHGIQSLCLADGSTRDTHNSRKTS